MTKAPILLIVKVIQSRTPNRFWTYSRNIILNLLSRDIYMFWKKCIPGIYTILQAEQYVQDGGPAHIMVPVKDFY